MTDISPENVEEWITWIEDLPLDKARWTALDELVEFIIALRTALDAALAREERFRENSRGTFDAMVAMRDSINEHIPMPSLESDLLQGPENSVFCATVAEAVIAHVRAALADAGEREAAAVEAAYKRAAEYVAINSESPHWSYCILALIPDASPLDRMLAEAYKKGWRFAYSQCVATGSVPDPDYQPRAMGDET